MILVDPQDQHLVALCRIDSMGYAYLKWEGKRTRLHRVVMGANPGELVDHVNQNKADCRRENLRLTDKSGNGCNSKKRSHNTSGFRGVHLCKITGRWRASIVRRKRTYHLGRFDDVQAAARAYDDAARIHHGEFACLNFPDQVEASA